VIAFLNTYNPHRHNLDRIAWRMKDDKFHKAVLDLLRRRHVFSGTLWSYAIQHNNLAAIREYLEHREDFINRSGAYIDTTLLTIDPVERWTYQHLEYSPLVNARAHRLGAARTILNDRFREQYARLMRVLAYHPDLDDEDLLALSYYMLLQDRVEAGAKFFDRVNRDEIESEVQYDYLATYVAFYREDTDAARKLVQQYENYRVDRWRELFANASQQLDEIEGADATVVNNESRAQRQGQLAATQSTFDFDIEDKTIELRYKNLDKVRVNYYLMDIELLFSRNPFVKQYSERFSFIRPNHTEVISLPPEGSSYRFEIPQQFRGRNVLIEIEQGGMRKSQASYAHSLDLDVIENYGQIKVTHDTTGLPQSKTYVKVFARMMDGQIRFYKDGYTDLRGRFDYASLSTNDVDYVDRFSLLVLSDSGEAIVREAAPPTH